MVRAPITIVLEMADSSAMAVPPMAAALIAYGTARLLGKPAIYHALSRELLPRHAGGG